MLYNSRTGTCKILHTVFLWMDEQSVPGRDFLVTLIGVLIETRATQQEG